MNNNRDKSEEVRKNGTLKRFGIIARPLKCCYYCFIITIVAGALVTLCESVLPQILRFTVDCVIGSETPDFTGLLNEAYVKIGGAEYLRSHFYILALAVVAVALFYALFSYLSRVYTAAGSELYCESMRNMLYSKIERLPFSWHSKNNTGDIIQRCTSDVETVRRFVANQLVELFRIVFMVILAGVLMVGINPTIAIAAFAFMPVVFGFSLIFFRKISSKFKEADEAEGVLSTVVQENLTGVRVVRAFGQERRELAKFDRANTKFADLWAKLGRIMSVFWALNDVLACFQLLTVLLLCVLAAGRGELTAGECIAFTSYTAMISWPVRSLGRIVSEMSKAGISVDRLGYILDSTPEDYSQGQSGVDFSGDIAFEHVSFSYRADDSDVKVLDDLSFNIKGGQTLGIIGGTGSGKSTIAALLCRLYDLDRESKVEGKITVGGVDISGIGLKTLRGNIGIVLQEPFLFSRTIAENITITDTDRHAKLTEEAEGKMKSAARVACVDEAISEFGQGYDTVVGERGVTLSGGQKQRVAIARALYCHTPIVIFDDSLSAVDTDTDAKIRASLRDELGDATVIIITHRITSLMSADKILVLDHGRAAQFGTHAELTATDGIYRDIYNIQQAGAKSAAELASKVIKESLI